MQKRSSLWPLILITLLIVPALTLSQSAQESRTLNVNGQPGQATVIQMNGRSYVDLEALARIVNGSLSFNGNQITLTLSSATSIPPPPDASGNLGSNPGLSKGFLNAGIEAMFLVREWHSALANAIQNQFPIAANWSAGYRNQAARGLRLASVAASTDSDQSASQLLTKAFNLMDKLSNQYVATRQSLTYISPESLTNDPLDQKLLKCGHSLAAMAASGQFVDDGSCQ